ncbi:unnamed protein product [Arabidopsis lyrata]|nr:unnamed protein product [Arabidopsis lyrata]
MDTSSGSSCSNRSRYGGGQVCDCGLAAKIFKSKTERNPNRRFYGCELYKVQQKEGWVGSGLWVVIEGSGYLMGSDESTGYVAGVNVPVF